jgi:hypothetical protein
VWYCVHGERHWHTGTTESISRSGAIIRTREANRPGGRVRVVIELPHEGGASGGCLTGIGQVVRAEEDSCDDASFAIAVKHYRVQRRDHVLPIAR